MWFNIKYKSTLKYGAIHLYNLICYSRSLSNNTIDCCIKHTLKINAYFAHSENILFAMLNDNDNSIRQIAIERIIKAREHEDISLIRKFKIPIVNFDALSYHTIIIYNEDWVEPRLTMDIPTNDLHIRVSIDDYPCHSQAVERTIRIVSETSLMYSSPSDRDGRVFATIQQRCIMPAFNHKSQFIIE